MELLDSFTRTFQTAVDAGRIPSGTAKRHAPALRRCAGDRDRVRVLAPCHRSRRPLGRGRPGCLLMLTGQRLVVTTFSPVLRKLTLCLNAELHHLNDVTWTPEPTQRALQLAVTMVDGVREYFWIRLATDAELERLTEVLAELFRDARPAPALKKRPALIAA